MRGMTGMTVVLILLASPAVALADPSPDATLATTNHGWWCKHTGHCRDRPVFFDAGMITRRFTMPAGAMTAFRTTMPTTDAQLSDTSLTGDLRFGGRFAHSTFLAMEAEFGKLASSGSNVAAAYLVGGTEGALGPVRLAAELAVGARSVRYFLLDDDHTKLVIEPRVRAELWASPQFTIGATVGSTLGELPVWMAGFYLGVRSPDAI